VWFKKVLGIWHQFIISGSGIYGAAVVPDSGVGNTWQRLTLVLHEFLSNNGLTPSRLHIVISFLTHADHVFLGLPRFLVPGNPNRVMELMHQKTNKKVSWKRWSKSGLSCSIVSTRDKSIVWMNWNSSSSMSGAKNTQFFWWGYWPVVRKTSSVCPC